MIEGNYRLVKKIGEGTYGTVFLAVDQRSSQKVAVKKVKIRKAEDGLPKELLREIETVETIKSFYPDKPFSDLGLVDIQEVFVGKTSINIVYSPYIKNGDLYSFLSSAQTSLTLDEVSSIFKQLVQGLHTIHSCNLMHRDLKPSNILIDKDKNVLICDYGQTRVDLEGFPDKNEEIQSLIENLKYTLDIGSRWYKAPELLFGCRKYRKSIDIWSLGCILAELLLKSQGKSGAMFQGQSDIDQMVQIGNYLGTPNPQNWSDIEEMPDFGKIIFKEVEPVVGFFNFHDPLVIIVQKMLRYSGKERINTEQLMKVI